jgi:hypothetical protein
MLAAIPTMLLLRLCRASPEQLAAIERLLEGAPGEGAGENAEKLNAEIVKSEAPRYCLRKGLNGWRVVFSGRETVLPDEKGVGYVAVLLLDPPGEPVHGAELANRAFGDAVVHGQRNLAVDDQETVRAMSEVRRRCRATLDDPDSTDLERREAQTELDEVSVWARRHMRGTEGNEQRQVRAIRQAIRRLLTRLRESGDPVLVSFGEHLENYLWRPSARGAFGGSARVRAGLAGRFTYEPPDGVRWES